MKRFWIFSGIHGKGKSLEWLARAVEARRPEGILFGGGVLDPAHAYASHASTAWGLTAENGRFLEHFFGVLGRLSLFCAVIPGPWDIPLEEFLRLGMHAEIEFPGVHLVHGTVVEDDQLAIAGLGGTLSVASSTDREVCSRTMAQYQLRSLGWSEQPHKILLLSVAPPGALGGREGNSLAGELLDSLHPALGVVGGPDECRGIDHVSTTTVVNPGHLAAGWAAWLDWARPPGEQFELVDLKDASQMAGLVDLGVGD